MTMMDDNMTILDDESTPRLLDSGSSVLILESVSEEDEGIYFCHVSFNGVSLLTSAEAQLTFNGKEETFFQLGLAEYNSVLYRFRQAGSHSWEILNYLSPLPCSIFEY